MRKIFLVLTLITLVFFSCNRREKVIPAENLEPVDNMISDLNEPIQTFEIGIDSTSVINGKYGTVIYINPENLNIELDSLTAKKIEVQLIEMTNKSNLLLQNAQTVSNENLLVSGGAYYINITAEGKNVTLKEGKSFEVEFPKLAEEEMMLFIGEKDSLGQINWEETNLEIIPKDLQRPIKPIPEQVLVYSKGENSDFKYIEGVWKEKPVSRKDIRRYEKLMKEYRKKSKTYSSIELMDFGWINVDRFLYAPSPRTKIKLVVNNDSIKGARFYLVFKDINSIMSKPYWKGQNDTTFFKAIPTGKNIDLVALSSNNKEPFLFHKEILTTKDTIINVEFEATKHKDLKKFLKTLN